jgi:hypothetical protein
VSASADRTLVYTPVKCNFTNGTVFAKKDKYMKVISRVLLILGICSTLNAQTPFHIGSTVLDLNTGIEIYNSTNVYSLVRNGQSSDTTVSDKASNSNFSLGLEVGLNRFFGLGVRGKLASFFRSLDAVTNARADIFASDLALQANLHVLPLKRFDLVLGGELGFSKLKVDVNDIAHTLISGNGSALSLYVNPRFYMKRLGFNFRASMPLFNYKNLSYNTQDAGNYLLSHWKGNGFGLSLGIQYKFF